HQSHSQANRESSASNLRLEGLQASYPNKRSWFKPPGVVRRLPFRKVQTNPFALVFCLDRAVDKRIKDPHQVRRCTASSTLGRFTISTATAASPDSRFRLTTSLALYLFANANCTRLARRPTLVCSTLNPHSATMPSQTSTAASTPGGATPAKRFELPALDFKFGSLTDGTDIPPPLPSPVQEKAAPTPPDTPDVDKGQEQKGEDEANGKPDTASPKSRLSGISVAGTKRRAEDAPTSPTLSNRPGSIRRLFSRSLLNQAQTNGNESAGNGRPKSRGGTSVSDSKKAKRASGWFGRLLSNDNGTSKSATPLSPPATDEKKPTGPPPPMIPELSEINTKLGIQNDSSFDGDLFKNIK
ncbi:uncharacterized protein P884DRAFT_50946, partial [Thermothelomyces heterothallicus CBS 202.75]|uniref:uncharacterized protein n=1 Tax=Thermothelomyces heterothallicus CBS 202.75 TaxID=1149848 RepID=UPI003742A6E0